MCERLNWRAEPGRRRPCEYDADGQRVRKSFGGGQTSTYYLRGPLGVLSEFEGASGLVGWSVDYIYAAGRLIATTKPPAGAWHSLTVTHYGGPGRVASSPSGLDCGSACTGRFTQGSSVTLTATPNDGLSFVAWGGSCGTGTSPTVTVTMGTSDLVCTATFSGGPPEQLTVTKTGSGNGTVTSTPGGMSCGATCTAEYAQGTPVTLTAAPLAGARFATWGGACSGSGTSPMATVTMSAALTCTASFIQTYTLTVNKTGPGAAESLVTTLPAAISCGATCSASYDTGTSVTLLPEEAEGYQFAGWSGSGCGTSVVTLDQARACTATFAAVPPPGCDEQAREACRGDVGWWNEETCTCDYEWLDPLVIPLDGHPVRLTSVAGGVRFDINGDGVLDRVAWTAAGARAGFLVLDRNGNGAIDTLGELFGQTVSGHRRPEGAANSFADLAAFDLPENGGNGDGLISAADAVFAQLRLWVDRNHDGASQPGELLTLAEAGVASIELGAQPVARRDRFGNYFKYRAVVHLANGRRTTAWDVFLAARLNGSEPASAAALPWPGAGGPGPVAVGFAGLGAGLIALSSAGVVRRRTRGHGSSDPCVTAVLAGSRLPRLPVPAARLGVTGATTVAVVLLWPAASFGQQTWQVVEYYDTDALGSVRAVTDAQGQVVARHDFLPFGEELAPQSPPHDKKLFTGQERDFETGQDYFNARQLRTDLGRFLAPDPISSVPRVVGSQGLNAYSYVRNNPLGLVDPSGLEAREPREVEPMELDPSWDLNELPPGTPWDQVGENEFTRDTWYQLNQEAAVAAALASEVPYEVVAAIAASVSASNNPSADARDKQGGFHEEGGIWGRDAFGNAVPVPCVPGMAADPSVDSAATIVTIESKNPSLKQSLASIDGQWHVHPKGWKVKDNTIFSFRQPPGPPDLPTANYRINIVVGAETKRVYFYVNSGDYVSMSLKAFLRR